jgi:hypothetical protein
MPKKTHKKTKKALTYIKTWPVILLMLLAAFIAVSGLVFYKQDQRIKKIEQKIRQSATTEYTQEENLPACGSAIGIATSGGSGQKVLSRDGDKITLEDHDDAVFTICSNVKVYDVETGDVLDESAVTIGSRIWIKAAAGNYIKEIRVVSSSANP